MVNQEPLISVIVPVYNVEPYLKRCLSSILAQTYRNLEIICVNDGSTDNSLDILNEFAEKDSRIKVLSQANSGVSTARNAGIDQAHGEYITFVDSDDTVQESMYTTLMALFDEEEIDIVHCGYRRVDPDGSIKDVTGTGKCVIQSSTEALECLITGKLFVGSLCNKIYKIELFQDIRLDPTIRINEDILANIHLFLKARKSCFIDLPLYVVYSRNGSATNATKEKRIAEDSAFVSGKIWELFQDTSLREPAAERLYKSLVGLFQVTSFSKEKDRNVKKKELIQEIDQIYQQCGTISRKQVLKYKALRYVPFLYKPAYKLYNRVRKPNWDVA